MTKRNERSSPRVARIAARVLAMKAYKSEMFHACVTLQTGDVVGASLWRDIRALAASCLTQSLPRNEKPKAKKFHRNDYMSRAKLSRRGI